MKTLVCERAAPTFAFHGPLLEGPHMALSVVTGSNRGIGLALVRLLKARGDVVVAACREKTDALAALGVEIVTGVEVSNDAGVARLVEAVGQRKIDLLINNAGILSWNDSLDAPDFDGIRRQFEVNALAPLRVTAALKSRLERGAKVALITSRMGSIGDNGSGGFYGYRMSKAALNMAGKSLAIDLAANGVSVVILHPGMVKTDMTGAHGQVEPEDAARGLLARIDALSPATSGTFLHANGEALPW
jgi:NAD(P)-dependent dehydrogenase (short-subunit alcohol dehydrogenase family)